MPETCFVSGRELSRVETFINVGLDGEFTRDVELMTDDWRPIGREHAQPLRDRGFVLSGLVTPL